MYDDFEKDLLFGDRTGDHPMTADAATGCEVGGSSGLQTANCPMAGITGVRIEGGDRDDELRASPRDLGLTQPVVLDGGPGNDDISGPTDTDHPVHVLGGEGDDTLDGGDGADVVDGGPGTDTAVVDAVDVLANCEHVDVGKASDPGPNGGGGAGACVIPKVKRAAKLVATRKALKQRGCRVAVRKVRSKVRRGRVVGLTRKGGGKPRTGKRLPGGATVVVKISRGR